MNRAQRRQQDKKDRAKKYSLQQVQRSISIAIEMMKLSKGHLFSASLKDRCVFCGVSMKTKKQCDYKTLTLFDRLQTVLVNPTFYTSDNLQALWLQHGNEYQDIKLPLAVEAKDEAAKTK